MNPDALLGRVRKLLAMAEAEGLAEAAREAYNIKAAELIAQYGIDRALVEEAAPSRVAAADLVVSVDSPYARDKISLLASIAAPLGCRLVHRTVRRDHGTEHSAHLFGMDADIGRVQLLFTSLLVQQAHGLAVIRPPRHEDPRAFRRSWMAGFALAVAQRLTRAERTARERAQAQQREDADVGLGGPSVAVVLADRSQRGTRISPPSIRACGHPKPVSSPAAEVGLDTWPASEPISALATGCPVGSRRRSAHVDRRRNFLARACRPEGWELRSGWGQTSEAERSQGR